MNRKSFLALLGGVLGALALGVKAKAKPAAVPFDPTKMDRGTWTQLSPEYLSSFGSIEIAGVPIYCDPYCPEGMIFVLKTQRSNWEERNDRYVTKKWVYPLNLDQLHKQLNPRFDYTSRTPERHLALLSIVGAVKIHGDNPTFAVVAPRRWTHMREEELAVGEGHRIRYNTKGTAYMLEQYLKAIHA
jgi:hypothetical protein